MSTFAFLETEQASGATFSPCGQYRYNLWRHWGEGERLKRRRICWIMLNPSVANDVDNDPTITKVVGFTRRWGYNGFDVVNIYAFKATKPRDLWAQPEPIRIGPENDTAIIVGAQAADLVVCAWGANGAKSKRAATVVERLRREDIQLHHLGLTKDGQPWHPLMLPYPTSLIEWA